MKKRLMFAALAALSVTACDEDKERNPLPDWRDGYDMSVEEGDPPPIAGGNALQFGTYADRTDGTFAIVVPEELAHPIRVRKLGSADEVCEVTPGETGEPAPEIDCVIEIEELDLLARGMAVDVIVPGDRACAYLSYHLAQYENWQVGEGPSEVSWTIEEDGTPTNHVNARDGAPLCEFDYRDVGGPNCCTGPFQQTVLHAATGTLEISQRRWGGRPGDCYDGAAYLQDKAELSDFSGFPFGWYIYAEDREFVEEVRTLGLSAYYAANVPLAGFFDEADHDGGPPAAMRGEFALQTSLFECQDHAAETFARIRLTVREWNEAREFNRDGDPDTQGVEPDGTEIDDFPDLGALTPGADTYPELYRPNLSGSLL